MLDTLKNQPTTVDLSKYRSTLKNQAIVDEAEKLLKGFKPVAYDVSETLKAIDAFEGKAVSILSVSSRGFLWFDGMGIVVVVARPVGVECCGEGNGDVGKEMID